MNYKSAVNNKYMRGLGYVVGFVAVATIPLAIPVFAVGVGVKKGLKAIKDRRESRKGIQDNLQ